MNLVALLALLSVLFVPPRGHLRLEYVFILILAVIGFIRGGSAIFRPVRIEAALLIGLAVSVALSLAVYSATSTTFHWRDLMSIVRYVAMVAMLVGVASLDGRGRTKSVMLDVFCLVAAVGSVISIIQYYDIGGLNSIFLTLYRGGAPSGEAYFSNFVLGEQGRRVIGTAGNPNLWAYILAMFSVFVAARVIIGRRYQWTFVLLLAVVALLMTGSRSAAVGFIAAIFVILFYGAKKTGMRLSSVMGGAAILVLIPAVFVVYTTRVEGGSERFNFQNLGSLYLRVELWRESIVEYSDNILIGRGPAKGERRAGTHDAKKASFRDNIYVSLYVEQGLLGLFFWALFVFSMWSQLRNAIRLSSDDPPALMLSVGMMGVFVAFMLFNLSADAFFTVQPATIFILLYGITVAMSLSAVPAGEPMTPPPEPELHPWLSQGPPAAANGPAFREDFSR